MMDAAQFTWKVDLSGTNGNLAFDLNAGTAFFFGLCNGGTSDCLLSQFINITSDNGVASTSSDPSTITATTTSAASSTDIFGNTFNIAFTTATSQASSTSI
ncbi:hypothetical protein EYC80_002135 [Monilinia laxa]|uniref:Uncharacterized protein n=1 Tax=Monilinia laxa TaxID=61186 RepID=A0A5N6K2Y8_MONLA|nr:hypothetical protein EYC80_002135 [Monilinia laxa]